MCKEIECRFEKRIIPYESSHKPMKKRVENIINGSASEMIWLLEHQEIYTAGTSAKFKDLLDPNKFSIYKVERGGQYTYHGPGQRVVYVMLDIRKRSQNLREFVKICKNCHFTIKTRNFGDFWSFFLKKSILNKFSLLVLIFCQIRCENIINPYKN